MINFLQKRRKTLLFIILGGIFFTNNTAVQAAISSDLLSSVTSSDDLLQSMATLMSTVINVLTFLSLWILGIIGELVGTEYITGEAAMNVLLPMWRYVRDLVNISFVLVLVGLAFTNLYSSFSEGGNWTIKEKLPKIIIAIVVVNFSSLFFRIMIDAVNVGSIALFSIADSQLEANRATSVQDIIGNRSWKILAKPEYLDNSISVSAYFDAKGEVVKDNPILKPKYVLITPVTTASIDGSCDSSYNAEYRGDTPKNIHYVGQVLYTEKFQGKDDKFKGKIAVCNSFSESINDIFCAKGDAGDEGCMFKLNNKLNEKTSQKYKKSSTAQNLFLAFGIQFIHLERLPTMAANVNSLQGVLSGALFGIIMSVAYIIALIAFFVALVTRMFVLWIAIIGSPVIVASSIMGFEQLNKGYEMFVANLIIPLKMALAFGVSFVMISGMSTMRPGTALNSGIIDFGPQLANLSLDAYGLFWQAVTIFAFWKAARWATEESEAKFITDKLFDGAETVGGMLAKSATIENQFMSIPGDTSGAKIGLSGLAAAPLRIAKIKENERSNNRDKFFAQFSSKNLAEYNKNNRDFMLKSKSYTDKRFAKELQTHIGEIDAERFTTKTERNRFVNDYFKDKTDEQKKSIIAHAKKHDSNFGLALDRIVNGNISETQAKEFATKYAKDGTKVDIKNENKSEVAVSVVKDGDVVDLTIDGKTWKGADKNDVEDIVTKVQSNKGLIKSDKDVLDVLRTIDPKNKDKDDQTLIKELFKDKETQLNLYSDLIKTAKYNDKDKDDYKDLKKIIDDLQTEIDKAKD